MTLRNDRYEGPDDIPDMVPVFPLSGALLLPRAHL
ncbi:MAG: peptidase S16, partial [Pseudomonadota bacterium]